MVRYENECVDCGKPCIKTACENYRVKRLYCDECDEEVTELYEYAAYEELCADCLLKRFEVIR